MPAQIPDAYRDLLDRPIVITLVTVMPNGQPQATPVYFCGDYLIMGSAGSAMASGLQCAERIVKTLD